MAEDPIAVEDDPLKWWRIRATIYPNLAMLVKKTWCIPASSVRSEEVFSVAGDILRPNRARLSPENVHMLVFLAENIGETKTQDSNTDSEFDDTIVESEPESE